MDPYFRVIADIAFFIACCMIVWNEAKYRRKRNRALQELLELVDEMHGLVGEGHRQVAYFKAIADATR